MPAELLHDPRETVISVDQLGDLTFATGRTTDESASHAILHVPIDLAELFSRRTAESPASWADSLIRFFMRELAPTAESFLDVEVEAYADFRSEARAVVRGRIRSISPAEPDFALSSDDFHLFVEDESDH